MKPRNLIWLATVAILLIIGLASILLMCGGVEHPPPPPADQIILDHYPLNHSPHIHIVEEHTYLWAISNATHLQGRLTFQLNRMGPGTDTTITICELIGIGAYTNASQQFPVSYEIVEKGEDGKYLAYWTEPGNLRKYMDCSYLETGPGLYNFTLDVTISNTTINQMEVGDSVLILIEIRTSDQCWRSESHAPIDDWARYYIKIEKWGEI